jgi:hypothetical protein
MIDKKIIIKEECAPCAEELLKKIKLSRSKSKMKPLTKVKTCFSKDSLIKIAKAYNKNYSNNKIIINNKSKEYLWNELNKRLSKSCDDDKCWSKLKFVRKLGDDEINYYTFKPDIPDDWKDDKYAWLSNYDIYYVMKQYEKIFDDFIFLGPVPSDCHETVNCELSKINIKRLESKGIGKIGIVFNHDVTSGGGTHWCASYIDLKNNEINYFDSYGTMPIPRIKYFLIKLGENFQKIKRDPTLVYNDKRFQYKKSECGMFSIYFILERLYGKTMKSITKSKMTDDDMNKLREYLFNWKT